MNPQQDQKIRELFQQLKQVDEKLTSAFPRLEQDTTQHSLSRRGYVLVGTLASVLIVAGLWALYSWKPDSQRSPEPSSPQPAEVVKMEEKPSAAANLPPTRSSIKTNNRRKVAPASVETASFIPLATLNELPPLESATVVRVELSPTSLRSIGFAVEENNNSRPVQADLVIGQDGLARAIRILPGTAAGADR